MILRSPLLDSVPGLAHGFTTARPVDGGPGRLDLGPGAPASAWTGVAAELGLPQAAVALLSQVHGAEVIEAQEGGLRGQGDALVSQRPGLLLAIRVADCVPVLLAGLDPQGRPVAVAAVHAGWRGLAAGVIGLAVQDLSRRLLSQGSDGRILASVGPCIGVDAYEVGPEVVEGIARRVPPQAFVHPGRREGRWQADLRAAAAWQLREAGVREVEQVGGCSFQEPDLHSYRRDGAASGRMAALIGLRP